MPIPATRQKGKRSIPTQRLTASSRVTATLGIELLASSRSRPRSSELRFTPCHRVRRLCAQRVSLSGSRILLLKTKPRGRLTKKRAVRTGGGNNIWGACTMYCGNLWERVELSRPRRRSMRR